MCRNLMEDVVEGLKSQGWKTTGGGDKLRLMEKRGDRIKVYKHYSEDEPTVVRYMKKED